MCPCGSGLKYKRCCKNGPRPQPVMRSTVIDLGGMRAVQGGAIWADGSICAINPLGRRIVSAQYSVEVSRKRNSQSEKPKVLNLATGQTGMATTHPDHILRDYNRVFIVDTNYPKEIGPKSVCLTAVFVAEPHFELVPEYVKFASTAGFEFRDLTCDPERLGWVQTIETIKRSTGYDARKKTLILVDSHLGDLRALNERRLPILDDYLLPEGFTLSYASADTGQYAINKMMRACDAWATDLLKRIQDGEGDTAHLNPAGMPHASRFRFWPCA